MYYFLCMHQRPGNISPNSLVCVKLGGVAKALYPSICTYTYSHLKMSIER